MQSKAFAKGSLDAVHETLESLGLGPEEIERSLGWARGHYQRLFDEPGEVSLDDYSALVHLTQIQPLPSATASSAPPRLPVAFGRRPLLRVARPGQRDGAEAASGTRSIEVWASSVLDLILLLVRLKRLESDSIARILGNSLSSLYDPPDSTVQ